MNLLFVNLGWPNLVSKKTYKMHFALPPLDLIIMHNIAQANGHKAHIFDGFVDDKARLYQLCNQADWIIVSTTPYHMWQCPNADWDWIKGELNSLPKNKLIIYGLHASVFPEQTLRETNAYAILRREPESVLMQFIKNGDWLETEGISYLKEDALVNNPLPTLLNMDELAVQEYAVDTKQYGYFLLGRNTGVFESSRGCPWKCTFCDQEMYSWKYRKKNPHVFAEEVLQAIKLTGMTTAYFYDLEFTIRGKHTLNVIDELIKRNIKKHLKWACQTRADCIDEQILDGLKAAGCTLIHFGVESANPKVLEATNKQITLETIERGVRLAKKKGFQTACFFMFGLPEEAPKQFDNTLEFARSLNPTYASFHFAVPFPGTPLYELYLSEHKLPWGTWPATYFNGWSHEQITKYLSSAYKKFYLMPKKLELQEFAFRLSNLPAKLRYFANVV